MNVGKKKLKRISHISVMQEILEEFYPDEDWYNDPPSTWIQYQTEIYDMFIEFESKFHKEIKNILNEDNLKAKRSEADEV